VLFNLKSHMTEGKVPKKFGARSQVNVGPVHNIFISSYIDYTVGSAQYNWLLNDLQSIDRSKTPW